MGLSASMWTGVSGLLAHGERMNVLGNNIANVNTVGFKASNMYFEDFIYQYQGTTAKDGGQVGRGVSIAAIYGDFSQGGFETTNEATDLAVGGDGFFGVSPRSSDDMYYTRAGNFRFDKEGFLTDPHGYVLQGWEIEEQEISSATTTTTDNNATESAIRGVGAPTDIQLEGFTCPPEHTSRITMVTNLNSEGGGDNTPDAVNPFFALASSWDATNDPPLGVSSYAYSSTLKVYDEGGTAHNVTVFYDQVSNAAGKNIWEYVVAMEPSEEARTFSGGFSPAGTSGAGLLNIGTMTFDSAGQLEDISSYTPISTASDLKDLSQWGTTAVSQNGYPLIAPNFSGLSNASWVIDSSGVPTQPTLSNATGKLVEMNFGVSTAPTATWDNFNTPDTIGGDWTNLPGFGLTAEIAPLATTSYAGSSSTLFQSQDGYATGFLQNIDVDRDGIMSGRYSNGVSLELYQVTLYDFTNYMDLRREGGNLFTQTLSSGEAFPGPANNNGLGSIASYSLEQSNVDLAREFVNMITTQRGFSANGKVITTTDQMLSEVIMLKR